MKSLGLYVGIFSIIVLGIQKLIMFIAKKQKKNLSPYLTFAVSAVFCGLIIVGIAMLDILTPGGDLNGMIGQILLLIYIPTVAVLLIGDLIMWRISRKKQKQKDTA